MAGASFNVHAARALGTRMVTMADEQDIFEDWTRTKGKGPEVDHWMLWSWPCDLALEYANEMTACDDGSKLFTVSERCLELDVRKRLTQAPMGRSISRVGRRLLDMLDGRCAWAPSAERQPSECQKCGGIGYPWCRMDDVRVRSAGVPDCPDCRGTGHNLRGVVPAVEWPAAIRRKVFDGADQAGSRGDTCWIDDIGVVDRTTPTRVVPRGQHRDLSTQ